MTGISASSAAYYNSLAPQGSNWLNDAASAIIAQRSQGGMLGTLQNATSGSLHLTASAANAFASISQGTLNSMNQLVAKEGAAAAQQRAQKQLADKMQALSAVQNTVQPKNVLDPTIFFADGSTLDTNGNILTRPDGSQFDTTTGLPYVNPADLLQLGNGAYLNTSTNIMTMANGTQIDTVTGLKVSKTA